MISHRFTPFSAIVRLPSDRGCASAFGVYEFEFAWVRWVGGCVFSSSSSCLLKSVHDKHLDCLLILSQIGVCHSAINSSAFILGSFVAPYFLAAVIFELEIFCLSFYWKWIKYAKLQVFSTLLIPHTAHTHTHHSPVGVDDSVQTCTEHICSGKSLTDKHQNTFFVYANTWIYILKQWQL